jgi:outer membrane protein TolC
MSSRVFGVAPRLATLALLIVVSAIPLTAPAAPNELSFADAVHRAVERAPVLAARHAQGDAAQAESQRAGALPDPMLSVGITNLPVTGRDAFDASIDEMTMKTVGVRQDIPARAKREASRAVAAWVIDEAQAKTDAEQANVRRAAAIAWIDLWAAQLELSELKMLREQAALAAKIGHVRVKAGTDSAADALAADAAVLELDNRIAGAEADLQMARAMLQRWTGDGEVSASATAPDFTHLPYSEAEVIARLDHLPALAPVAAQVETAAVQVDAARAERHPDWSVEASYGQRSGGRSDMLSVQFGIGLPLFTHDRQDHGVAAREADYQAALDSRDD